MKDKGSRGEKGRRRGRRGSKGRGGGVWDQRGRKESREGEGPCRQQEEEPEREDGRP